MDENLIAPILINLEQMFRGNRSTDILPILRYMIKIGEFDQVILRKVQHCTVDYNIVITTTKNKKYKFYNNPFLIDGLDPTKFGFEKYKIENGEQLWTLN
jgi:hypothetical protein